ncbi:MAG: diphosphate--fructose-6-phosphate 1-phosphotransferase [Phycisphaeraceae bacterium]|nr:MAG: diphosphate--fructose-6-phosphate 1-phosphotransferase [Phycisphaeraceae bacterium]
MANLIEGNAVIGQSGGPTAVINQSLVGVVEGLMAEGAGQPANPIKRILGMRHGVRGLTHDQLIDLTDKDQHTLNAVARTPSAGLGSTRDKPDAEYCKRIFHACEKNSIRYFFYIGGNDSSDTCRIVNELANEAGYELRCFHVPKTVDNDLPINDHTPGFPSAARYVATAFMADSLDNASIPGIKINVVMGRHAGFLTAAAALARRELEDGPHVVCLPEVPFDLNKFVDRVAEVYDRLGRCQIAVSEGIQDRDGQPIGAMLIQGEADAHGNVQLSGSGALGDQLSLILKERLKPASGKPPRVRADTFGYLQRCWPDASPVDAEEARRSGRYAGVLAASGDVDGSVAILRTGKGYDGEDYRSELERIELTDVAAKTKHMDPGYILGDFDVSQHFIDYCKPLVGELPVFGRL